MPRPNKPRAVADENHLAERIAYEREHRGWTYEGLALRMTDAGCPINASALYKVEKGSPRRRITYAEAVTLARVFEVPLDQLAVPPALLQESAALTLAQAWIEKRNALGDATDDYTAAEKALRSYLASHEHIEPAIRQYLESWWGQGDPDKAEEAADYFLLNIRGHTEAEFRAHIERFSTKETTSGKPRKKT